MLSIGMVSSAGAASAYFDKDNYYGEGETSPSRWMGQGAAALGLSGPVDARAFRKVLEGEVHGTEQRLGFADRETGDWKHQAGWDLTFSAPKSVTLLAMLGGDRRIVGAHDRAVANTVAMIERDHAATRVRRGGQVTREKTGSLTVAAFRHDLSRLQEPQLHTHAIVVNMTEGRDGKWRSIVSRDIYRDTLAIGLAYRQELALELRNLGYEIDLGKQGMFEVRGVNRDLLGAFSTRRTEVVAWLEGHGIDPAKATAAQSQRAALATRNNRITGADRTALGLEWRATATDAGLANLARTVNAALARGSAGIGRADRAVAADDLLKRAIESVAERSAAWTSGDVLKEAGRLAPGKATSDDLKTGLTRLEDKGDGVGEGVGEGVGVVVAREVTRPDPVTGLDRIVQGLTRKADKALEQRVVQNMVTMPDIPRIMRSATGLVRRSAGAAKRQGFAWNDGQREATRVLLESRHAVTGLQGLAGTAKTTTVLRTVAEAAAQRGHRVVGLAPTASAADELGRAISGPGRTLAGHLLAKPGAGHGKQLWIVDEASMISSRDMDRLLTRARAEQARLILVGDVHQLGAVEAGAPFRQMQQAGMPTAILERIVRQRNAGLREAVEDAARGRIASAIGGFEQSGGQLVTVPDEDRRFERMARDYAALSPEARRNTIVIEPSVQGRARLNAEIRTALVAQGALGSNSVATDTLRRIGMTRAEAREIVSYVPGTLVRFRRGYRMEDGAIGKGEYLRVSGTADGDKVLLERMQGGGQVTWRPGLKGAGHVEAFERVGTDLRTGDRIRWHENTTLDGRTIRNGQQASVARITAGGEAGGEAVVDFEGRDGQGGMVKLDLRKLDHRHWSHAYAETAHAAQGRTSDRVMLHAESSRLNLVNQKSIYVALSRARETGAVYTDDAGKLVRGAAGRKGDSATASDRDEIMRARADADRVRQQTQSRTPGVDGVKAIVDRLDRQIRAITGRGLELDGAKAKLEPKAPEIRRGPSMRR